MKPIISIIVPVFNVEKYLDRCVQSLINQTYSNIQVILVDDGSTDRCPVICDNYGANDNRIKVIHKENGGLSEARNAGIHEAEGEYLLFVDSDDYIELDTCERFINVMKSTNPDVVVGNAKRVMGMGISLMRHTLDTEGNVISGNDFLKAELKAGTMFMAVWLNLYNRNFLRENALEFKSGILHEDEQFTPRVFLKATKIISTDIVFYNYLLREGSIVNRKTKATNAIHIIQTCFEMVQLYKDIVDRDLRLLLNDSLVSKYLYAFQIGKLYRKDYNYLIDKQFLLGNACALKNKFKVWLFCLSKYLYYVVNCASKKCFF